MIQSEDGPRFDSRVLDYRIDVDNVLKRFHPSEKLAVLLVNRDGLTHAQAIHVAGIRTTIEDIEIRMGQAFELRGLDNFLQYVNYLR
jgi:hypothetical protein